MAYKPSMEWSDNDRTSREDEVFDTVKKINKEDATWKIEWERISELRTAAG